jgi:hypothetical protein
MRQPTNIGSATVLHGRVRVQAVSQEPQQIHRFSIIWPQPGAFGGRQPAAAIFGTKRPQTVPSVQAATLQADHARAARDIVVY